MTIKKLTNNLVWKILSLFLACLLWLAVINIEDPQVTTTIRGIAVEKQNENVITSQKQAIQYVAGNTVDVKVKGRRSVVYKLTANNIKAYVDMRNLSITDAVDIQIDLPNDVELISKTPSSVSVHREKIIVKQMQVQYQKSGEVKTGFVDLSPTITPNVIELEAAESTIYKIEKVVVPVNIDGISGDFTISVMPQIYDYAGSPVRDVNMSVQQVQVKVPVEKTKILPVSFTPADAVGENYAYLGVTLSQNSVAVRGKPSLIDSLQELPIDYISIAGMTEKQTVTINLAKLLPDGVSLNQDNSTLDAEINIEPIVIREFSFAPDEIEIRDLQERKEWLVISENPIKVSYRGIESKLKLLTKESLQPHISVEGLSNGIHAVTVQWQDPDELERVSEEERLTIEIFDKETEKAEKTEQSTSESDNQTNSQTPNNQTNKNQPTDSR